MTLIICVEDGVRVLHEVQRVAIEQVLGDCRGNITRAAKALGIKRQSLQRKIKRFRVHQ